MTELDAISLPNFFRGEIKFFRPGTVAKGYLQITLCKNGKYKTDSIHRLVALAFIPNPHNLPVVHHRDDNHAAKLTEEQVRYIRKVYIKGHPEFGAVALAKKFNVTKGTIFCIIRGQTWKHVK